MDKREGIRWNVWIVERSDTKKWTLNESDSGLDMPTAKYRACIYIGSFYQVAVMHEGLLPDSVTLHTSDIDASSLVVCSD